MSPSSRSVRTGIGSRGGRWHADPEYRKAWFRTYRRTHPTKRRTKPRPTELVRPSLSEVLLALVLEEVEATSMRRLAARLLVDHSTVVRWCQGSRAFSADTIDALVDAYGLTVIARQARRIYTARRFAAGARR